MKKKTFENGNAFFNNRYRFTPLTVTMFSKGGDLHEGC